MTMKLIKNAIRTPDGTVLVSRHRHDYREHVDANGKTYMIDGGLDYCRCSNHGDEVWVGCTLEDGHSAVREALEWGTRGPKGDQPLTFVKLCDMTDEHIQAVLDTQFRGVNLFEQFALAMEKELVVRRQCAIGDRLMETYADALEKLSDND